MMDLNYKWTFSPQEDLDTHNSILQTLINFSPNFFLWFWKSLVKYCITKRNIITRNRCSTMHFKPTCNLNFVRVVSIKTIPTSTEMYPYIFSVLNHWWVRKRLIIENVKVWKIIKLGWSNTNLNLFVWRNYWKPI